LTIDVVDTAGKHLGGVIAPGPTLMRDSLLRSTSDIAPRMSQDRPNDSLFADHTHAAVVNGCRYALAGLIDTAYRNACERLREAPRLLITGGAAAGLVPLIESAHERVDDLVLRGMAVLLSSSRSSS
jgi:type III pantothenate kinase